MVITGASSGIGRATALRFAAAGANVVMVARREEALREVASECRRHGVRALVVPVDVTAAESVERVADRAVETFGRLDVWINNAAVTLFGPLSQTPLEDFRRVLDVNIMGYVHDARAALKHFRRQDHGVLINISSVVGEVAQPFTAVYSLSKAGINALSVSIRSELAREKRDDVHVVSVLPATVDTPFFAEAANYTGRKVLAMPPVYSPQRVADTVLKAAKKSRHEVPVGPGAKQLVMQHRATPAAVENFMAVQVDKKHLSHKEPARANSGNLYRSAPRELATIQGGWGGRSRQAGRRVLTGAALTAGAVVALPVAVAAGKAVVAVAAAKTSKNAAGRARAYAVTKIRGR
ncbi:SDR family oxidoreductase [Nesterenkonia massiliensis]|uniref:SDR family oxidoreductase n=1 Tax=Nesterenkonia massiliensis TaxID=1232429 RepID=A0ABT2HNH9_9MICC|nr:SDR family oxidoreductase [Nesterenkonia massiliensis]